MESLMNNIFTMKFDIIVPLSFMLIAVVVSFLLFFMRFISYRRTKRKFAKSAPTQEAIDPVLLTMLELDLKYPEKIEDSDSGGEK